MRDRWVVPALVLLNLAVWGRSLGNDFVFDDLLNIVGNRWIKDWALLPQAFLQHAAGFDPRFHTSFYRPLMHVLDAAVYAVAGAQPWAYHLLNVGLQALAVLLVYVLTRSILARWSDPARDRFLPLVAALVFTVHPAHTEAVAWIAGVTDLSYTVFGLAGLLVYLRSFDRGRLSPLAAILLLGSALAKETGVTLLAVMLLLEWIEARSGRAWHLRSAAMRLVPALSAIALYAAMRLHALGSFAPSARAHAHAPRELAAAALGLLGRYLGALLAPIGAGGMRFVPSDEGFGSPAVLAGLLVVAACVAALFLLRRTPLALLPAAVIVLPILPTLYLPAIEGGASVFGERYLYLPVLGLGWLLGAAFEEVRRSGPSSRRVAVVVLTGLGLAAAGTAVARTGIWSDSVSLWTDAASRAPSSAAAQEGLCFALYAAGKIEESVGACERALALDPTRVDARINRATGLLALGRAAEARAEIKVVLGRRPESVPAWIDRGLACMVLGQHDEALRSYRRALELDPESAEAHNDLGVALVRLGRAPEALPHFEQAVRSAPEDPEYVSNLRACPR